MVTPGAAANFIDFFWETDFDDLWPFYPAGFSDILFANTSYTYLINLGTPFVMQLGNDSFEMKSDGFLPRHKRPAIKLWGIKYSVLKRNLWQDTSRMYEICRVGFLHV